jgi:hypothetical protein
MPDRRLREMGIDPDGDPGEIMREVARRYRALQTEAEAPHSGQVGLAPLPAHPYNGAKGGSMSENKAWALAYALDADMLRDSIRGGYAIGLTRQDGTYAFFRDTHGAVFTDEETCLSSDSGDGIPSEWGTWGSGEPWAIGLATLIGGQAHHRIGNAWEVLFQRGDGKFVVICSDEVEIYQSRGDYDACGKPEYVGWDWDV